MPITIPSPAELGLPEKFWKLRDQQVEALLWLLGSTKRVKAFCGPTGFGKTLVYILYALITKLPTCFVTDNRGLQDQLMEDFSCIGLVDIRGRRNYPCDLKPDYTCEDGYASRCPYKGTIGCPSSQAEMRAATSLLVVTNYDKWTSAKKYGQGMQHFKQVVFDEGHRAPAALERAMQVIVSHKEIDEILGMDTPSGAAIDEFVNWKPWAAEARQVAQEAMEAAQQRLKDSADPKQAWIRTYLHLRNLTKRLATLSTANPNNWISDSIEKGFQFDPVRAGRYGESTLLLNVPSIVIVSATLRPKSLYQLGLGRDTFDYREFESDFDPTRCPIYYVPTMRVDNRARDLSQLWIRLDQIAAKRTDRKGIVHTISYARREEILSASRFAPSMLVNAKGDPASWMVEDFKQRQAGAILVSPSVGEGYDFPGDQCRWQFVCKIPFPDGRNRIIRARSEDDREYGAFIAINKLVQIFGRIMRSKQDWGENFIGDDHLEWFLPRYGHLAPKSFHMFYKRVSVLPQPPRLGM